MIIKCHKGEIQAPAGAEIYDLCGHRCSATGLTTGIYVVQYADKVIKAIVK